MTRILIADDQPIYRQAHRAYFEHFIDPQPEFVEVQNGELAIAKIRESVRTAMFDLVVTDYQMDSGPDGVEVARVALNYGVAQNRIFIVTSYPNGCSTPRGERLARARYDGYAVLPKLSFDDYKQHIIDKLPGLLGKK